MNKLKTYLYKVECQEQESIRIDKWLAQFAEIGSRSFAIKLIDQGLVSLVPEGVAILKSSLIVKNGMQFQVQVPEEAKSELIPNHLALDIVYEDDQLIVINKPAGLVVHPSSGHREDSIVHRLLGYCSLAPVDVLERPGVVHRLDVETSGLIVLAKNINALRHLSDQFKNKTTHRIYEAIVFGRPIEELSPICSYLNRHPVDRKKRASVRDINKKIIRKYHEDFKAGKWAVTHFKILKSDTTNKISWLELKLETGRTHQIRVHLSELGYTLLGDLQYGADKKVNGLNSKSLKQKITPINRVMLHAKELGFIHPTTGKALLFFKEWPDFEKDWISKFFDGR